MADVNSTEDAYLQLLEFLPLPYQSLDVEGNFLQVNQAWLDLFCCRREDVIGRFFGDFMHESSHPLLGIAFAVFKREGFVSSPVFEARRQGSGDKLLVTVNGRVERNEQGDFVRTHCVLTDVTARAQAEAGILELNDLLQQVSAQLPGMVFQYRLRPDGSACFPYASEGIRDLLHIKPDDVRDDASPAFRHVHPDDSIALLESIEASAMSGLRWFHRFRVQFGSDAPRWLQGNATPQREEDGGWLWHGFITDVTQEVAAEVNLRIAASVFANTLEGITITDAGGFIADVNPAFSRITGYQRDEVLGRSPKMLSSGHQDAAFYQRMWHSIAQKGAWRGEVWNRDKAGEVYPVMLSITAVKDGGGQIGHYIGTFTDIRHLKEREAQLDHLAHYDPLTGLPNRRLLTDRLRQGIAQTRRTGRIMAVCVLDLDGFKLLNDRHGHAVGDQTLMEVARRLIAYVRENDTVARLGGDEFVLLLQDLERIDECDGVLSRILQAIAEPLVLDEVNVCVTASVGVTLFPQDDNPADALLRHADQALYQAKRQGRNRYKPFRAEHDRRVRGDVDKVDEEWDGGLLDQGLEN